MRKYTEVFCPKCKYSVRMPDDCGRIEWTCVRCGTLIVHNGTSTAKLSELGKKIEYENNSISKSAVKNTYTAPAKTAVKPASKTTYTAPVKHTATPVKPTAKPTYSAPAKPTAKPTYSAPAKPAVKPTYTAPVKSAVYAAPEVKKATRTIQLSRAEHAHKGFDGVGIKNIFKDLVQVPIYLDGVKQGVFNKDTRDITISMDSGEHKLSFNLFSYKATIPAGTDSYYGTFFNEMFHIGIMNDHFEDELAQFVISLVRGKGFADRILDSNNRNKAVELDFRPDHILVYYYVNQTKGFSQWASGREEEKIYYNSVGLNPPAKERQPGGYWSNIKILMRELIVNDKDADLTHVAGGYTFKTKHSLY